MGNSESNARSGDGLAIHYVKDLDLENPNLMSNMYGFTNEFRGEGFYINTQMSYPDRRTKKKLVQIFGHTNQGKNVKPMTHPDK